MPKTSDRPPILLPKPRQYTRLSGFCELGRRLDVRVDCPDPRLAAGVGRFIQGTVAPPEGTPPDAAKGGVFHVVSGVDGLPHPHAYRLTVRANRIEITGKDPAACHHGVQTLRQLVRNAAPDGRVACCEILDWPDFATRGLLHDVTRGKVPTLDTLKLLADRLAELKCNQLQLNLEHAFVFSFDPEICGPEDGLTPDEVTTLDAYCRERFIDLVPALATLGHMGRILSMPRYRHLAEIGATKRWEEMTWPERMRGLTLDVASPESHRLVEAMWSDVLAAFSSPVVNVCGDEPYDLGHGKNRERFAGRVGEAYLEHIRRTCDICTANGRRVQFWSDVVRNHPDLFHLVPKDATVMHWGYDDLADYAGTRAFVDAGLDTIVCPGTSGWKRILNGMNLAERNISDFAVAGRQHGATGLVNTDWGDHGHFNLLACSWHGIALGAAKGWRSDHPIGNEFDRSFAVQVLGLNDESLIRHLREAARSGDEQETWRQFWMPIDQLAKENAVCSPESLDRTETATREAVRVLQLAKSAKREYALDVDELRASCDFLQLWITRMRFVRALRCTDQTRWPSSEEISQWLAAVAASMRRYRECWHRHNKQSGLRDIENWVSLSATDTSSVLGNPG